MFSAIVAFCHGLISSGHLVVDEELSENRLVVL